MVIILLMILMIVEDRSQVILFVHYISINMHVYSIYFMCIQVIKCLYHSLY